MTPVVTPVVTPVLQQLDLANSAARAAFAAFGSAVNARNPQHLPRSLSRELALLDPATNPWLANLTWAAWVVRDGADGTVIGRIAAMHPTDGDACLGLYEAENDEHTAHLLLDAGLAWLKARGAQKVLAPVDFSIFQGYRCQTAGFDAPPFVGEPRNPAYYAAHFESVGFTQAHRWESHDVDLGQAGAAVAEAATDYADAQAIGYRFEDYRTCTNEAGLHRTWTLINASYGQMPGFVALPWERFRDHYAKLPLLVDKRASCFVFAPDDVCVGFGVVLKDMNAALRAIHGHSAGLGAWLDRLRFLRHMRGGSTATAFQVGVPYREIKRAALLGRRNLGRPFSLGAAIYHHCTRRIAEQPRYRRIVIALLREGAPNTGFSRPWADDRRAYTLYERQLT